MARNRFKDIVSVFDTLEGTSSRNKMMEILAPLFKELDKEEAQILSYIMLGRVAPPFVSSEFDYSEKGLLAVISSLLSVSDASSKVREKRTELGDIGDTVEYFAKDLKFTSKNLNIREVYEILWSIVNTSGTGSVERKNKIVFETLHKMSPEEAKYFTRIICGKLRFGISSKTLLDVFSYAVQGDKGLRGVLDRAYGVRADIGHVCSLIVGKDPDSVIQSLESVTIQPGVPVLPRLVSRVSSFEEVFERLGDTILVQNKYDGLRCQIHKYGNKAVDTANLIWEKYIQEEEGMDLFGAKQASNVRLYTRELGDVTEMFPEIVESAKKLPLDSFIMDSEVLGWDRGDEKFLTFQETMQRRRKHGIGKKGDDIPVRAMVFDVLFLNGKDLSLEDTSSRLEMLAQEDTEGGIYFEDTKECSTVEELNNMFEKAISNGFEGLIVKNLKGAYLPGARNYEWIKLKKSMSKDFVDTIDLVAVGYFAGSGRRKDFGVGAVLGAIYNPEQDIYEVVCKVGTGFTDEQFRKVITDLDKYVLDKKPDSVLMDDGDVAPDVWVEPHIVFTVEADEVTMKRGGNMPSLRFPRLIEWGRDKEPTDATTLEELKDIYKG